MQLIIRQSEQGEGLVVDVLKDGYNIIDRTIYDASAEAQALLEVLQNENNQ